MTSYLDPTTEWVNLVDQAQTELSRNAFRMWLIAIGIEGSDPQRTRKGRELLPIMRRHDETGDDHE